MKQQSETRENYLKCIFKFSGSEERVSTNTIANFLKTSPASVTDMIIKLKDDGLVDYLKHKGVTLTSAGKEIALKILRKHRLWEVFLVEKLHFSWDQVHDMAEQLEHIDSPELIAALDKFLGSPKFDPHGDPIPNEFGEIPDRKTYFISEVEPGEEVVIASVGRSDPDFLQYLERMGLTLNRRVTVIEKLSFDDSLQISVGGSRTVISGNVAHNLLVLRET
ncbi:MAG: metal-dependent transcriptional regulator [Bacteroidia bacterium]|nr:metal-dependent transcriptional regulator [Bacteroidia bacterium]